MSSSKWYNIPIQSREMDTIRIRFDTTQLPRIIVLAVIIGLLIYSIPNVTSHKLSANGFTGILETTWNQLMNIKPPDFSNTAP